MKMNESLQLRIVCHVKLEAEDRDGSPWTSCALDLYGAFAGDEAARFDWKFRTDDDAANALAVLPWSSW
jgi:hypothetical protein